MPPAYEVLLLNTAIPQIQAAQSGDTYVVPRDISFSAKALIGYTDYTGVGTNGLAVAGNVGIGTNSPTGFLANKLVVATGGTSNEGITIYSSSNNGSLWFADATSGTGRYAGGIDYQHSTNELIFYSNTQGNMRLDSSGNLGLGVTPSAWSAYTTFQASYASLVGNTGSAQLSHNRYYNGSNDVYISSNYATMYRQYDGSHYWHIAPSGTANTTTVTSGKSYTIVTAGGTNYTSFGAANNNVGTAFTATSSGTGNGGAVSENISFTQAMTLDASGNLGVGTTSVLNDGKFSLYQTNNSFAAVVQNTSSGVSGAYGIQANLTQDPNTTDSFFYKGTGNATDRFYVRANGGIGNYQANDVNLSDRREKTNFAPAKSYLDVVCAIPVQTFKYIDQTDDELTLGVVAQDVQAVAPELVSESNWGTKDKPKMRLSIYQTDLQYALMKCIQEQQALINDLRARVAQLEQGA